MNVVHVLVIVLDCQGKIVRFNHTCEQTTGYSFDEVKGKLIWDVLLLPENNEVLQKLLQDLGNPLSNINMAIHMLKQTQSNSERDRYLAILQQECSREIELLNEIKNLQVLLTPENAKILQKFNLLNHHK